MREIQRPRVGLHHLAVFRGYLEHTLDLSKLADRYLETGADLYAARRVLRMVERALIGAALRKGKHGAALLLKIPRDRLPKPAADPQTSPKITFEEFVVAFDPDGIMGESEQLEHYLDVHGGATLEKTTPSRTSERNKRLFEKRLRLVHELAPSITATPAAEDNASGWFDPGVAERLTAAGLVTLGQITDFANTKGFRWYESVPKLGRVTAKRITAWLSENNRSTGKSLSAKAIKPARHLTEREKHSRAPRLGGGELLAQGAPAELSGVMGTNRGPSERHNRSGAANDLQAIECWLAMVRNLNTASSYRKEAERLLLWCIYQRGVALSSLEAVDLIAYIAFLEDIQPTERWVMHARYAKTDPRWRPFYISLKPFNEPEQQTLTASREVTTFPNQEGVTQLTRPGLSRESIHAAITALKTMFGWLTKTHYLDSNPFDAVPKYQARVGIEAADRHFVSAQWMFLTKSVGEMDRYDPSVARLRILLKLTYAAGPRLSEICAATLGDLSTTTIGDELDDAWQMTVLGKGNKRRHFPVPKMFMRELAHYLTVRGFDPDPRNNEPTIPLLSHLAKSADPLTPSALHKWLKSHLAAIALDLDVANKKGAAEHYRRASAHWLRHTYGAHAVANNVSLNNVQRTLGHSSLTTTTIYVQPEDRVRHQEAEEFMRRTGDF